MLTLNCRARARAAAATGGFCSFARELAGVDRFVAGGFPVLVGVSRKGMTGRLHAASDAGVALADSPESTPTSDRLEASVALGYWCALMGVDIIRVHDVAPTVQGMKVVEARSTV